MENRPPREQRPHASTYIREKAARESGGELQRVKDVMASRGLSPRKRFGQNFLIRDELCERIVEHGHLREDDVAVEIGPGAGGLTSRIARRVKHLIAVEKDLGLVEYLQEEFAETPRVTIVRRGDSVETRGPLGRRARWWTKCCTWLRSAVRTSGSRRASNSARSSSRSRESAE